MGRGKEGGGEKGGKMRGRGKDKAGMEHRKLRRNIRKKLAIPLGQVRANVGKCVGKLGYRKQHFSATGFPKTLSHYHKGARLQFELKS